MCQLKQFITLYINRGYRTLLRIKFRCYSFITAAEQDVLHATFVKSPAMLFISIVQGPTWPRAAQQKILPASRYVKREKSTHLIGRGNKKKQIKEIGSEQFQTWLVIR